MDHYIDITLFSDPEFRATVLMSSLYSKFHKVLCDQNTSAIGVSFPASNLTLGNVLRIHGSQGDLAALQQHDWLGGMSGYCQVSEIRPVPETVKYRTMGRKQTTMSQSKLKRLIKRGTITEDEARQYRAKMFTRGLDNPYVELVSASNGQRHRRYIEFGELVDSPVVGTFDHFGLSKTATVPWF